MKKKRSKAPIVIICIAVAALVAVFFIYVNIYYKALPEAQTVAKIMEDREGDLYFTGVSDTGIIIYPGGKVAMEAYAPLAAMLNIRGYTVAIAKMPFHLSIFDNNKALSIIEKNPQIENWVIVGHSLGGVSASSFAHDYPDKLRGIVFLASYPNYDLSGERLFALSIEASNDEVLNKEAADEAVVNYPQNYARKMIKGGNHAGFGCYGGQKGDGEADIPWEKQNEVTAEAIYDVIENIS